MQRIVLSGDPVAQARARIFRRGNRVMTFDPQASLKRELKIQAKLQLKNWVMPKYPRVSFRFYMPIPKSMKKEERKLANDGFLKHVKKPDVDNLIKLYLDVLSGIAFEDDNCVSLGSAIKIYSLMPKTVITICEHDKLISMNEIWSVTEDTPF